MDVRVYDNRYIKTGIVGSKFPDHRQAGIFLGMECENDLEYGVVLPAERLEILTTIGIKPLYRLDDGDRKTGCSDHWFSSEKCPDCIQRYQRVGK